MAERWLRSASASRIGRATMKLSLSRAAEFMQASGDFDADVVRAETQVSFAGTLAAGW